MISEPTPAKGILDDDHGQTDEYGVGDTYKAIAAKSIAAEDEATDDRLEQIVGEAHSSHNTEFLEYTPNTLKSVPYINYCRDNHQHNH